jgi:hypothetical protein
MGVVNEQKKKQVSLDSYHFVHLGLAESAVVGVVFNQDVILQAGGAGKVLLAHRANFKARARADAPRPAINFLTFKASFTRTISGSDFALS